MNSEADLKRELVEKYRKAVTEHEAVSKELARAKRELAMAENTLFTGSTPSLAAVGLQNLLGEIASQNEVNIQSMRVLRTEDPPEDIPGAEQYMGIPVEIRFGADIASFQKMLYEMESAGKMLVIKEMNVRSVSRKDNEEIQVNLTVLGFMKTPENRVEEE